MAENSMAAVVQYALVPGAVELREVPVPTEVAEDEVLVATRGVGVCGSDIHQYHNTQSWRVRVPVILGHEFTGTLAQVGKSVHGFREGDRVTSETAARICGECYYCRTGEYNLCPKRLGFGYGLDGAMATYVRVPARCLHHLPDSVSFDQAALTEPCCVAYNATSVKGTIRPGDAVLVLGPGAIGLLCLMMARLNGAGWLGMVGRKQDAMRLETAGRLGAERKVVLEEEDVAEVIRQVGDGLGADVVIDASGASIALKSAIQAVRPGGQIIKVGWGPQPLDFSIDPLVQKGARIQGCFSHNYAIWEKVIALMACGSLDLSLLLGRKGPLEEWQACFESMASGAVIKAVLKPGMTAGA